MNTEIIKAVESDRAQKTFYPTPEPLAEKLLGGIKWNMVDCVLEPSAGKGDLALFAAKKMFYARHSYPPHDDRSIREAAEEADIDCIEIDPLLRNTLEGRGFRVIHDDFLSFETQKRYSLIVMNPPFDQGAEHFLKAFELMEHGGEIRCILNAQTIRNPCTEARKRLVAALQTGAEISFISGAFHAAERQTDVDVALIKKVIPQRKRDSSIMQEMKEAPTYKRQEIPEQYGDLALYSEMDEWVNRYNYEVACGIRLIEEWQAMSPNMLNLPNEKYNSPIISLKIMGCSNLDDCSINKYIRETRYKYWNMIFKQPTIVQRLTSNLINELHDSISQLVDYEFSIYNIMTLIIKMNAKVIGGIEDTIVALFDSWTRKYWNEESPNRHYYDGWKTNDCFKVGKKVIIPFYSTYSYDKSFDSWRVIQRFRDIEKVFDFLDCGRTDWEGSLDTAIRIAESTGCTRNIDTKYFKATFFKKGTAHLVFKDENLLEKFNIFAGRKKGWLPNAYGKCKYSDMSSEEQRVVDSFQGRERYEAVMRDAQYFLAESDAGMNQFLIAGA